jgi:hypothetical protein
LLHAADGVPVHRFAAPPSIAVVQPRHGVWNDIVMTLTPRMDPGVQDGIIEPETRFGAWTTSLIVAGTAAHRGGHSFAVTDPALGATIEGVAVLHSAHVLGVANVCAWKAGT